MPHPSQDKQSNLRLSPVAISEERMLSIMKSLPEGFPQHLAHLFTQSDGNISLLSDNPRSIVNDISKSMSNISTPKKVRFNLPSEKVPTREARRSLSAGSIRRRTPHRTNSDDRWEAAVRLQRATRPLPTALSPTMPVRRQSVDQSEEIREKLESTKTLPLTIPVRRRSADREEKVSNKPLNMPRRRQSVEDVSTADLLKYAMMELTKKDELSDEDREYLKESQLDTEEDPAKVQ